MLLYVTIGTNDLLRAGRFYDAALRPLGFERRKEDDVEIGYAMPGDSRCRLWIVTPHDRKLATIGNGSMVAFEAEARTAVDEFYRAALAAGGTDEGEPGLRPFHAHFYAAYVRDPDGNKLSAVCERPQA
ncbi:VOC family protein [Pararhizobium capsulatum]|uniref:VOC family protein n=1 Tax=Pararhizobium capsulatum TaxID=34014 RepID=UPI0027D7F26B|nr:VOC family protein [Pararhizobium capsulatum]